MKHTIIILALTSAVHLTGQIPPSVLGTINGTPIQHLGTSREMAMTLYPAWFGNAKGIPQPKQDLTDQELALVDQKRSCGQVRGDLSRAIDNILQTRFGVHLPYDELERQWRNFVRIESQQRPGSNAAQSQPEDIRRYVERQIVEDKIDDELARNDPEFQRALAIFRPQLRKDGYFGPKRVTMRADQKQYMDQKRKEYRAKVGAELNVVLYDPKMFDTCKLAEFGIRPAGK
jgi:hypothetical protein